MQGVKHGTTRKQGRRQAAAFGSTTTTLLPGHTFFAPPAIIELFN